MHNSQFFLFGLLVCAALALALLAIALEIGLIRVALPATRRFFSGVMDYFADQTPSCGHCGRPAKVLGTTAHSRWFYCECGHCWREEPDRAPEASAHPAA